MPALNQHEPGIPNEAITIRNPSQRGKSLWHKCCSHLHIVVHCVRFPASIWTSLRKLFITSRVSAVGLWLYSLDDHTLVWYIHSLVHGPLSAYLSSEFVTSRSGRHSRSTYPIVGGASVRRVVRAAKPSGRQEFNSNKEFGESILGTGSSTWKRPAQNELQGPLGSDRR